jgi:hypothetical protein
MQREDAADRGDRIDVKARPAGDAQYLVDGKPGDVVAPAFLTPQPFLADRGNQPVILERRRRGIVEAGLKRKDTHAGTGWDLRKNGWDLRKKKP